VGPWGFTAAACGEGDISKFIGIVACELLFGFEIFE
jgi:hypothetical protein